MMRLSLPLPGLTKIIYYTTVPARSRTRTEASVSPWGGGGGEGTEGTADASAFPSTTVGR